MEIIKQIIPAVAERKIIRYRCEMCGKTFRKPEQAEKCGRRHFCKHLFVEYEIDEYEDYPGYYSGIIKRCINCEQEIEFHVFEGIEENQEALKKLFDILPN